MTAESLSIISILVPVPNNLIFELCFLANYAKN